jgi:hypothetical protein
VATSTSRNFEGTVIRPFPSSVSTGPPRNEDTFHHFPTTNLHFTRRDTGGQMRTVEKLSQINHLGDEVVANGE